MYSSSVRLFFFNDTATTEIYTLSLHDALPIYLHQLEGGRRADERGGVALRLPQPQVRDLRRGDEQPVGDRKSTRLNSSHANISYAVFCLKKKKKGLAQGSRSRPIAPQ